MGVSDATVKRMKKDPKKDAWLRARLKEAVDKFGHGSTDELGRLLGFANGGNIRQCFAEKKPRNVRDSIIDAAHATPEMKGWFVYPGDSLPTPQASGKSYIESEKHSKNDDEPEYAGVPKFSRGVPVVGTARMGEHGYYEELAYATGHGDGSVEGYSSDPNAYALKVRGDSMYPAIRDGTFVVIEPNGRCVVGEYVSVVMRDGRKMVKELVYDKADSVTLMSVNGGAAWAAAPG